MVGVKGSTFEILLCPFDRPVVETLAAPFTVKQKFSDVLIILLN